MYFKKYYKSLKYPVDSDSCKGLRKAQLGAIHAIASTDTISNNDSIVVMPTGTGKTAVLMMAPYVLSKEKVLVVTPSVMVRTQVAEDFADLRTLSEINVFKRSIKKPKVWEMKTRFNDSYRKMLDRADVIIATPNCAVSLSENRWAKDNIDLVEFDEAHHIPAKTWQQIINNLNNSKHILFTATPFRRDNKFINGEIIYNYPMAKAYKDGVFGEIRYIPVDNCPDKDLLIAQTAERVVLNDRARGYNHSLMVRTDTKKNASELLTIYCEHTSLRLEKIDSSMQNSEIKGIIDNLKEGELDGIICVDMLGEGFDFPNLKIAAVHKPHKSLSSTLQFIGRFARTNATNIGTAKFIAANDDELLIENKALFSEDAAWQEIIIEMGDGRSKREQSDRNYYKEYRAEVDDNTHISLQSININCHDCINKVDNFNIMGEFPEKCRVGNRVFRNHQDNTVIGVGIEYSSPIWLASNQKCNVEYKLYVLHYQQKTQMLHIYAQSHSNSIYDMLLENFSDNHQKISKKDIHRVLGGMNDFEFFNSGMVNRYSESGESYRIMAGEDVSSAIDSDTGRLYSAGHVFCKAVETIDDTKRQVTIGYSSGSKIWSSQHFSIKEYVQWCDNLGEKIANESMIVKTNTNYDYIPLPEPLDRYPLNVFFAIFAEDTYASSPLAKEMGSDNTYSLIDFDVIVKGVCPLEVIVTLTNGEVEETVTCNIDGKYKSLEKNIMVVDGAEKLFLEDYLNNYPLCYKTYDDSVIQGDEIYAANTQLSPFDMSIIEGIDWGKYGTDVSVETPEKGTVSLHDTVKDILLERDYSYIIYDHGSGEIADYIAISENENEYMVDLFHIKRKQASSYNNSVEDVYEVSGQTVKSIIWLTKKSKFIDKISKRCKNHKKKFIKGEYEGFLRDIRATTKQFKGNIYIVQPGISKSIEMKPEVQEVLQAANTYVNRAGKIKKMIIWGSI